MTTSSPARTWYSGGDMLTARRCRCGRILIHNERDRYLCVACDDLSELRETMEVLDQLRSRIELASRKEMN
jgi:hypothetical protein